ncbi:GNAT family N-acetyltransferase [Yinghuangia seranimata]|uniref:GNAT family N-acetyltransferase n=1 Tax=Yinghuangia seranimata TaxID=408067 RepID=UPI00248C0D51|nr:GNAT family N-acetyltransferase [Yinghuangia seranimata]MDI2130668.1 GNAT family N-acetyltransferase [Yinghuangia seranimata]
MPELIRPDVRLRTSWLDAHAEWGPGAHEDGFGLTPDDDVQSPEGFAAWVRDLHAAEDPTGPAPCTFRWIAEGDTVLGGIALRHGHNDYTRWAGHIGYGIRPSACQRGLATWALGQMIAEAHTLGMPRLLLVCAADNEASAKTIEHNGGTLDRVAETPLGPARRYWITIAAGLT